MPNNYWQEYFLNTAASVFDEAIKNMADSLQEAMGEGYAQRREAQILDLLHDIERDVQEEMKV